MMMKIKTSELTGLALDWMVAKAEGAIYPLGNVKMIDGNWLLICVGGDPDHGNSRVYYRPSTDWSQAGPIIDLAEIGVKRNAPCSPGREWEAQPSITAKGAGGRWGYGPTPLIAAMRCFVASKLGDEVEVPDELVTPR